MGLVDRVVRLEEALLLTPRAAQRAGVVLQPPDPFTELTATRPRSTGRIRSMLSRPVGDAGASAVRRPVTVAALVRLERPPPESVA
jgi:hypothetical protein